MKILTYFWRLLQLLAFLLLLAFATRNTDPVTVRFYLDRDWQVPLVAALFAFFAAGVVFGILACLSRLLRQRRQIVALKRELRAASAAEPHSPPAVGS